jgi:hypothetical protein
MINHQQQKDEDDNDDRQRADALKTWRMECGYSQPSDYIFASADMDGKQPLWPSSAMEDYFPVGESFPAQNWLCKSEASTYYGRSPPCRSC